MRRSVSPRQLRGPFCVAHDAAENEGSISAEHGLGAYMIFVVCKYH